MCRAIRSSRPGSWMGTSPRQRVSTRSSSTSTQVTRCPSSARQAAVTRPTWPAPTTHIELGVTLSPSPPPSPRTRLRLVPRGLVPQCFPKLLAATVYFSVPCGHKQVRTHRAARRQGGQRGPALHGLRGTPWGPDPADGARASGRVAKSMRQATAPVEGEEKDRSQDRAGRDCQAVALRRRVEGEYVRVPAGNGSRGAVAAQ